MENCSIRDVASCDLDLHQVNKPIAARDRYASHARREVKLHRRLCSPSFWFFFKSLSTPKPPQLNATATHALTIRSKPTNPNPPPKIITIALRFNAFRSIPQIFASLGSSRRPHWRFKDASFSRFFVLFFSN